MVCTLSDVPGPLRRPTYAPGRHFPSDGRHSQEGPGARAPLRPDGPADLGPARPARGRVAAPRRTSAARRLLLHVHGPPVVAGPPGRARLQARHDPALPGARRGRARLPPARDGGTTPARGRGRPAAVPRPAVRGRRRADGARWAGPARPGTGPLTRQRRGGRPSVRRPPIGRGIAPATTLKQASSYGSVRLIVRYQSGCDRWRPSVAGRPRV